MTTKNLPGILVSMFFTLLFSIIVADRSFAQSDVFANKTTDSSSDVQNAYRVTDSNRNNYAYSSTLLGVLSTSYITAQFPVAGAAGDVINIEVQGTGQLLGASILSNITVRLYDSLGNNVANANGSSVLELSLLSGTSNIYAIRYLTNPVDTYKIKTVRFELDNLLTLSLLSEFRIYSIFYQTPCPPVLATSVHASGTGGLLAGYVDNPGDAVDADLTNHATLTVPLNLLSLLPPAYLDLQYADYGRAGDEVGFAISQASELLSLSLLGNLQIDVYDETGTLRATKSGFSLLDLRLLSGSSSIYTIGFQTPPGTYKIARTKITLDATLGLLEDVNVFYAYHFTINRPPVVVTSSGPTTICAGDSVTLTAHDSLGATTFLWSNGATTQSITVHTSGQYSVEATDTLSCSRASIPIVVTQLPAIHPVITGDTVLCPSASTGILHTTVTYARYVWSTGDTLANTTISVPGNYSVTVTDTNGCTGKDTATIITNSLSVTPTITNTTCSNTNSGSISLATTGGSGSYHYLWSTKDTTSSISSLGINTYGVLVTDRIYGCVYNKAYTVQTANTLSIKSAITNSNDCNNSNGRIAIKVVGGSGSYNYSWSTGATTNTLTGLHADIYNVTVTDNTTSCQQSDTFVVNDGGSTLTVTPTITNVNSCNTPNGGISLAVTGGSGSYTYTWSTGGTTSSVTGLVAGKYYVVVKDNTSLCSKAIMVSVTNSAALGITATITSSACTTSTGTIAATVSGGSGSYTYYWSTGATTASISNLEAGTYILHVTDNTKGCTGSNIFDVTNSAGPSATITTENPGCTATNNGNIALSVTGSGNTYQWSNGSTTQNQSSLSPGTYVVRINNSTTGCSSVYAATLMLKNQIMLTGNVSDNFSCASAYNGAVSVVATGGTGAYTYAWSTGGTTANITGIGPGTYSIKANDTAGCTDSLYATLITDTSKTLRIIVDSTKKSSCTVATNGSIFTMAAGGVAPYTYSWSNGTTAQDLANAAAGSYTVTVTDSKGCTAQAISSIAVDTSLTVRVTLDSTINSTCTTAANGAIYVTPSRGTTPYTYSWSNGTTSQDLVNATSGSYTVTVTDNKGCTAQATSSIIVDTSRSVKIVIDSTLTSSCTTAANGAIYITASRGTAPYIYSWSNSTTAQDLINATAGSYTVTVTDNNGCTATAGASISVDTAKTIRVTVDSISGSSCTTATNGAIYITPLRGTTPYTYSWSNGTTTQDLITASTGSYTVTVTDTKGCTATASASISVDTAKTIRVTVDSISGSSCTTATNGAIYITPLRGTTLYTYSWSNGTTTQDLINVAAGSYTVAVTDNKGCTATASASISVDTAKTIRVTVDSISGSSCTTATNGAIYITPSRGTLPYTYNWSNSTTTQDLINVAAGSYTVTVTDSKGCTAQAISSITVDTSKSVRIAIDSVIGSSCIVAANGAIYVTPSRGTTPYTYTWNNGTTAQDLINTVAGSYTVTVTDSKGCTAQATASITVDTSKSVRVAIDSVIGSSCMVATNGAVYITPSSGSAPYTYSWSNGATTQDLLHVSSGSYTVTVTDNNGCIAHAAAGISVDTSKSVHVTIDSVVQSTCNSALDGAIYVSPSGGTSPYTYSWSNGTTTQDLLNVMAGSYTVTVTDNSGCNAQASASVSVDTNDAIHITVNTVTNASCNTAINGSVNVTVTGGLIPYTYAWSNGSGTQDLTNVASGTYTLTVTDSKGCNASLAATIGIDTAKAVKIVIDSITGVNCLAINSGAVFTTTSGGSTPYVYVWSNGTSLANLIGVPIGTYTVSVKDAAGCIASATATVANIPSLILSLNVDSNIKCNGDANGIISALVTGGSGTYQYSFGNGATTSTIGNLAAGTYSVTVTDANSGCTATTSIDLVQPDILAAVATVTNTSCITSNGSVIITVAGGTSPYTYNWLGNTSTVNTITQLGAGNYNIMIQDAHNCSVETSFTIAKDGNCDTGVVIHNIITPNGDGVNDVMVIEGIEYYPNNDLKIFDKWGDVVAHMERYNNKWEGRDDKGNPLPSGTYYYLLKLNAPSLTGGKTDFTGYVMIQR